MQIKIQDKVFECHNQVFVVESVFEQINQLLAATNQKVSCLEIDGVEVYENYGQYIATNLEDIKTIIVKVKTLKELFGDTFISIQDYLVRAIPEIDKIVDDFYLEVSQDTWNKFAQLMDGLQFIIDTLNVVNEHQDWNYNTAQLVFVQQNLLQQIAMLQEALESQDRVRISDVLLYEIIPLFSMLIKEIDVNIINGHVQ